MIQEVGGSSSVRTSAQIESKQIHKHVDKVNRIGIQLRQRFAGSSRAKAFAVAEAIADKREGRVL
jgi:hypothetical protein